MNDRVTYINSSGDVVNFGSYGIVINENDLRDFAWSYTKQYNKITNFERGVTKKKIPAKFYGTDLINLKNDVFEKLEKDVLLETKGRLYIGDYYLGGYFTENSKKGYTSGSYTEITFTYVTDESFWKKETQFNYRTGDSASESTRGLNYPYDYPYDFKSIINVGYITNIGFVPCNFIAKIYGPVENPTLYIGANAYKVNIELSANEYLTIDTLAKKVYKTNIFGDETNVYKYRDINSGYIFEKIPTGEVFTSIQPDANYDITIIEERSEPVWT